jgi:amino acid adenylation domain-containing protein
VSTDPGRIGDAAGIAFRRVVLLAVDGTAGGSGLAAAVRDTIERHVPGQRDADLVVVEQAATAGAALAVAAEFAESERRTTVRPGDCAWRAFVVHGAEHEHAVVLSVRADRADRRLLDGVCWRAFDAFDAPAEPVSPAGPPIGVAPLPIPSDLGGSGPVALSRRAVPMHLPASPELVTAAFLVVLARYTGQERIPVAVVTSEPGGAPGAEVRSWSIDVDRHPSVETLVAGVGSAVSAVPAGGRIQPAGDLIRPTDEPVQACVDLVGHWTRAPRSGMTVRLVDRWDEPFPIGVRLEPVAAGCAAALLVADGLLNAVEVGRLVESLEWTVRDLATAPDRPVTAVTATSPGQRAWLGAMAGGAVAGGAVAAGADRFPATTLDRLVWRQAVETPDAIAVRTDDGLTSYRELIGLAGAQAGHLRAAGVRPGEHVLLALPRSLAEIVAVLGTVRAGACYVAVDPRWPDARLRTIADIVRPRAAIATPEVAARLRALGVRVLPPCPPDSTAAAEDVPPPEDVPEDVPPPEDDAAPVYVAFTSGSEGVPKGVVVPHRAVIRLALRPAFVPGGPGEVMLRFAPLPFDASTLEIWAPLLAGGALAVHPPGLSTPDELDAYLDRHNVTVAWFTAGLFESLASVRPELFGRLRQVLTGGDVVPPGPVRTLLEQHPGLRITNGYGPTENTTFTTVHHVDEPAMVAEPLPIGRPIAGTSVHVLDERGRLLPPGAVGELYTGGAGLALGYLNSPDETARQFVELAAAAGALYRTGDFVRFDTAGRLRYLGRRDEQVKIRGYRIELGEVRRVIDARPDVRGAVVFTVGDSSAERRLAAAVRILPPGRLADIRAAVGQELPAHQVPAVWIEVEDIPITANGKVDYHRLRELVARPEYPAEEAVAPGPARPQGRSETTEERPRLRGPEARASGASANVAASQLAHDCFTEVLGAAVRGEDDDFFMLGGDSLAAVRMIGQLRRRHGLDVSIRVFFEEPTLRRLTALIAHAHAGDVVGVRQS